MNDSETRDSLLKRIRDKRDTIKLFLRNLEPTGNRLTNFNIICGAIATVLTATPAIFGKELSNALGITDPNSSAWRIWVGFAALFSLLSTIAANLYKSREIASRLGKAQAGYVKLEGLETVLDLNLIDINKAAIDYAQIISEIPFISDTSTTFFKRRTSLDMVRGEINEPKPDQVVERTINCSGWVEGIGPGCHLWLAVEDRGFIWPKEREIIVENNGSWKDIIFEEGTTASFSLSLFVANNTANKRIRAWLDAGDTTGNYAELPRLPGTRRLASIDGLNRKNAS
jgi:hypothetical protein